jgi:hypothetical protein
MISVLPTIGLAMPTDADWGRLYNYNTSGDAGLVMPLRSYYFRDFFPGAWQNLAVGLIYRNSGIANDTANLTHERQAEISPANLFHFGISKSNGFTIPVATNSYFLGLRGILSGVTEINTSPLQLADTKLTLVNGGANSVNGSAIQVPLKQGTSSTPFAMIGIKFVFDQLSNQVFLFFDSNDSVALADEDANVTTLTSFLEAISSDPTLANASFSLNSTTNFTSYYIYWPYLLNKLMLQCVGAIKFS